jgi:amino acid permease
MAKPSLSITKTASGEHHLHRAVGLRGLTMISLGSIIGSGWLSGHSPPLT